MVSSCLAQENLEYGKYWKLLSDKEKKIYFIGMRDGMAKSIRDCEELFTYIQNNENELQLLGIDFIDEYYSYDRLLSSLRDPILKIVTDLYQDTDNNFIYISDMFFVAYIKLHGEPVESFLKKLREKECRVCPRYE